MKLDCFTKGSLPNVRLLLVAELPPSKKPNLPEMYCEFVSKYYERRSLMPGMRLDRTRPGTNQAARAEQIHRPMSEFYELEIKEWLREIRIEKLDRTIKPIPSKTKPTFINQGLK